MSEEEVYTWAVKNGDLDKVKELTKKDGKLVNKKYGGQYPINFAADFGQQEVISHLLENGADVNQVDSNGFTPLSSAAFEGHVDCIKVLLANGADKNIKDSTGNRPIDSATSDEVKALLQ